MQRPVLGALLLSLACGGCTGSSSPSSTKAPRQSPTVATTIKRVVVSLGRVSGTAISTTAPDGTITSVFDVLENGRGPHVDATIKLAANGTLAEVHASGHHIMGTPIDETFKLGKKMAHWKSNEEHGDREVMGATFFVPFAPIPDTLGLLVRALQKNGGAMALLPGGEAHLEKAGDLTVHAGAEARHLTVYAITGLDLSPVYVWMNDDGSWFGNIDAWNGLVPDGWQGNIDAMRACQKEADRARLARLQNLTGHKQLPGGFAYVHARVLDIEHGKWLPDQTVLVVGDTIKSVSPSARTKLAPVETMDLTGLSMIPGLWDMHAHLGDDDGPLDIAAGVTTVRDVGNDPDQLDDYKARWDAGLAPGPHVLRFGFIEGRNPKAASSKITAETPDEAHAAVEYYAKRHYEGIKIYNSVKPELVPLLAQDAHAHGMLVTGHIPVHMLAHEAVDAGYDGIEHINMLFLNFFATHETDTRDTTRFTLVGDKGASLDLHSKPVNDFIAQLLAHHTVIDPTIDAFEDLLVGEPGKITPGLEATVARLPVLAQRQFLEGGLPVPADKRETYRASFEKLLAMTKRLYDAKVPVVVGTDELAGLMLHHEMALLVRAGISPANVLKMATIDAARSLGLDKKTGSIAAGKAADLVVVEGDPLQHIGDAERVLSTMRGGVYYGVVESLWAAEGVTPPK